jgi:hypothetical protein
LALLKSFIQLPSNSHRHELAAPNLTAAGSPLDAVAVTAPGASAGDIIGNGMTASRTIDGASAEGSAGAMDAMAAKAEAA